MNDEVYFPLAGEATQKEILKKEEEILEKLGQFEKDMTSVIQSFVG